MGRKITVHRKAYTRKAYTRKDGTRVKETRVPATAFRIKDRGAPGRTHDKMEIEIGGKAYVEHIGEYTKAIAKEKAADIRKRGYNCRVIKTGKGWTVYCRRKK